MSEWTVEWLSDPHETNKRIDQFTEHKIIGFDMEWDSWTGIPSICQIASSGQVLLVDLLPYQTKSFPLALKKVLENNTIKKVGSGIVKHDKTVLYESFGVHLEGCIELQDLYLTLFPFYSKNNNDQQQQLQPCGLKAQMKTVLGWPNTIKVNHHKWKTRPLSDQHMMYAALDAVASCLIFERFQTVARLGFWSYQKNQVEYGLDKGAQQPTLHIVAARVKHEYKEQPSSLSTLPLQPVLQPQPQSQKLFSSYSKATTTTTTTTLASELRMDQAITALRQGNLGTKHPAGAVKIKNLLRSSVSTCRHDPETARVLFQELIDAERLVANEDGEYLIVE